MFDAMDVILISFLLGPDGQWIYFNSDRTGRMHVWRMKTDGKQQEQITKDDYNNWFPHPSPDGKWAKSRWMAAATAQSWINTAT